jgi:hypothetical protein
MEKSAQEEGSWSMDSGIDESYADTASAPAEEDLDSSLNPSWVKVSVDLSVGSDACEATMYRDFFANDMTWICQQHLVFTDVISESSPSSEIESWWVMKNPTIHSDDCGLSSVDIPFTLGVGELLDDVAVASDVTHWLEGDQYQETDNIWGAYTQSSDTTSIWAFGVGFQPSENEWVIRTVYSLPWN